MRPVPDALKYLNELQARALETAGHKPQRLAEHELATLLARHDDPRSVYPDVPDWLQDRLRNFSPLYSSLAWTTPQLQSVSHYYLLSRLKLIFDPLIQRMFSGIFDFTPLEHLYFGTIDSQSFNATLHKVPTPTIL